MPEGHAVKTMFAGIAAKYDSANHLLSGCFDFYWRYRLSQKVKAVQPKSIIDLATGSGDVAFKLREQLPERLYYKRHGLLSAHVGRGPSKIKAARKVLRICNLNWVTAWIYHWTTTAATLSHCPLACEILRTAVRDCRRF